MLIAVEKFIKELKKRKKTLSLLGKLAGYATEDDLSTDLAEQHVHYLYGTTKK